MVFSKQSALVEVFLLQWILHYNASLLYCVCLSALGNRSCAFVARRSLGAGKKTTQALPVSLTTHNCTQTGNKSRSCSKTSGRTVKLLSLKWGYPDRKQFERRSHLEEFEGWRAEDNPHPLVWNRCLISKRRRPTTTSHCSLGMICRLCR